MNFNEMLYTALS